MGFETPDEAERWAENIEFRADQLREERLMATDIGKQFDLMCKNHPDRPLDERARSSRLCTECFIEAWNKGARQADATWHQPPPVAPQDERSTDGRYTLADHKGEYSKPQAITEKGRE